MGKNIDNIVCINKEIFNKMLFITNNTSDLCLDDNGNDYLMEKSIYSKVLDVFTKTVKDVEREEISSIKGASLSRYNELMDKFEEIKYNFIRNNFNKIKTEKINEERLLEIEIQIYEEIDNIKKIPSYINQIRKELKEIKDNKLSEENINQYLIRFNMLLSNGGLIEEYISLKKELDLIIKKTYTTRINTNVNDDKKVYIVKENGKVRIMDEADLNDFSYGFIYSSDSIIKVTDKNNNVFVSFNNLEYDSYNIEIDESRPIGIYAVTYGEKSISPNYRNAQNIYAKSSIPFIEFDKTLSMNKSDYNFEELINNLLIDKGLENVVKSKKDKSFYDLFEPFINDYRDLKIGVYSEGNIINSFEFHFDYIFSQRFLDLKNVLTKPYSTEQIKEIFDYNIYFDFSIFRENKISKTKLNEFVDRLYDYRYNEQLNMAYHGINIILDELHDASDKRKEEILDIINSSPCKDSWLLANKINPIHKTKATVIESNDNITTFTRTRGEKYVYQDFAKFLKSNDGYAR